MAERQKRSQAHEARLARKYDGQRVPGSGNGWARKGDVRTADLAIEHKYTDAKSYSLKEEALLRHWRQALVDRRTGVFVITFPGSEWVVMSVGDFDALTG